MGNPRLYVRKEKWFHIYDASDTIPCKQKEIVAMIPEEMLEVLKNDGVVAIATQGKDGPHMVNTWNSYIRITKDERLLIPAGYMHLTEANIAANNAVLVTVGSSKVAGKNGPGTGFLIKGTAAFLTAGPDFEATKAVFKWARAVLAVTITSVTQTL